MKVSIIGASGFVGKALVKELLDRGHQVKAIIRNPEKLDAQANLEIVKADATNPSELAAALAGSDAVVSAFNAGWTNPNLYNDFLEGSKAIQEGIKLSGVSRVIFIGGAGSLYVGDGVQLVDTPQFPKEILPGATAARDYFNILKEEKELDWVFFSPAIEMHQGTSGERKGHYRLGKNNPIFNEEGRSVLSVEDLALVIVDELENQKHSRERFTAAY
jgi:uncharacterized protein